MKHLLYTTVFLMLGLTALAQKEVYLKGNIVTAPVLLDNDGGDVWQKEVTLDDSRIFLFSDKYVYFECEQDGYRSDNIRINGGTYSVTFDMKNKTWQFSAPTDEWRISAFGSSVCNGQGASGNKGYAYLYDGQLKKRYDEKTSEYPFYVSGVSIGGNTTTALLNRYDDLTRNYSRYVIIGLSMGNEGIHESTNKQQTMNQFSTGMKTLINKIKADGMIPVVMNNYTRGDFTADDYHYIKQMNLQIHQWDVPSVNTLGAIDDGAGHWASGFQQDNAHPTTAGHQEFFYAMPPSLFDAIKNGKGNPLRNTAASVRLDGRRQLKFRGEGTVHPFTVSVRMKGGEAGRLVTACTKVNSRQGKVDVDATGHVVYTSPSGTQLSSTTLVNDDKWHTVTLTYYYAQNRQLVYVDNEQLGEIRERFNVTDFLVGDADSDAGRLLGEVFFWRAALSPDEVEQLVAGKMLRSSLEIYVATSDLDQLDNKAVSMNTVQLVVPELTGIKTTKAISRFGEMAYDISGRKVLSDKRKRIVLQDGKKIVR